MLTFSVLRDVRFLAPVELAIPTGEATAPVTFTARFRMLGIAEAAEHDVGTPEGTLGFLRAALVGWEDVIDDEGLDLPFTPEARDALLDSALARGPLVRAYYEGLGRARRGN